MSFSPKASSVRWYLRRKLLRPVLRACGHHDSFSTSLGGGYGRPESSSAELHKTYGCPYLKQQTSCNCCTMTTPLVPPTYTAVPRESNNIPYQLSSLRGHDAIRASDLMYADSRCSWQILPPLWHAGGAKATRFSYPRMLTQLLQVLASEVFTLKHCQG